MIRRLFYTLLFQHQLRKGCSIDPSKCKWWKVRETDASQFNVSLLQTKRLTVVMYSCGFIIRNLTPDTHLANLKFTHVNGALCLVTHASW